MNIKQKNGLKTWLLNLYYISTSLTLFFIMAQAFLARNSMKQSSEWEKAKVTIENIERFKENLTQTTLYDHPEALAFSDRLLPDFSTSKGFEASDTLRKIYISFFEDQLEMRKDFEKTLAIFNAFAYPIIMGYASELGSFQSVMGEFHQYSSYIMPWAFKEYKQVGHHVKLLYRLWRVRIELLFITNPSIDESQILEIFMNDINYMLCFEDTEVTPASRKQYEKKLGKELKKIQKEIEDFRKSNLK